MRGKLCYEIDMHSTELQQDVIGLIDSACASRQAALSEYDSKRVLAAYGVPIVREELVRDAAEAGGAAERLGYPVAVKACSPALAHKSDRGLVLLNLTDTAAVASAVSQIGAAARGTELSGYLVQQMIPGKREVIVGGTRDPLFGACVMFGLGGILVEAVADVAFRLAPLSERDALEMLNEVRARRMLEAFRGEPAVDRDVLACVLMAVGQILLDHPRIAQVDVNPLILSDSQPVAVDALVTLASG
jgi:acetate---CoA ligase (ADP-forming) subunit beta